MEFCGSPACEITTPQLLGELRRLTFVKDRFRIKHGVIVMGEGEVEMEFCGNPVCEIAPPPQIVELL